MHFRFDGTDYFGLQIALFSLICIWKQSEHYQNKIVFIEMEEISSTWICFVFRSGSLFVCICPSLTALIFGTLIFRFQLHIRHQLWSNSAISQLTIKISPNFWARYTFRIPQISPIKNRHFSAAVKILTKSYLWLRQVLKNSLPGFARNFH